MLAGTFQVGERVASGPAAAWYRDALWLAYAATDGTLVVRSVDVLGDPSQGVRRATGRPCGGLTATAVRGDRLYVLYGTPGEEHQLTWTADGTTFAPPTALPIERGFTGVGGMATYPGGLAVLWAENAGGQAHLLATPDAGVSFSDTELPFRVAAAEPGLCFDDSTGHLLYAFAERSGGPDSFTLASADPSAPGTLVEVRTTPTPRYGRHVVCCPVRYRNRPGLHVTASEVTDSWIGPVVAQTAASDLSAVGGEERFGGTAQGLSVAFDGTRAWVAWFDADAELRVGAYAAVFDLPADLRARLGEDCDPAACPVDPRLVCAATDEVGWVWAPPRIANALRGDLIMTPGDGTGLIGSMLDSLDPRQYFDHMGIMVGDHHLVRHATMAHDRLSRRDPGRFLTGEFFGERAPVDGFRPGALTYGWPGTITQSVDDAFFTGFNTVDPTTGAPYNAQGDYFALNPDAERLPRPADGAPEEVWNPWRRQQSFADPEYPADEPYAIHNFPKVPAYRMETQETIHPVVVKPHPAVEAADPRVRTTLHRVAGAAERVHGHYRFYAYTDARIALDGSYNGPDGSWCEGTRGVVCSSFVWAAIQLANQQPGAHIEVEGPVTERPGELLPTPFVDGLYRYLAGERADAGRALHTLLSDKVRTQVYLALQEAEHDNRLLIDLSRVGLAALVFFLAGPVGAAAAFLGVTPSMITALKLALEDMPDDVATQMCNTLAADRADETDDALWESPGEGVAVSPDDIKEYWDPPDPASNSEWWHGLYGTTERMLLTYGRHEPRRRHQLERSDGPAHVRGRVLYRGQPVAGAHVRFGCDTTMTTSERGGAVYRLDLSAGRYEAVASAYWPATQELLTGSVVVDVHAGEQPGDVDITLSDPPQWRRLVVCKGRISVVRRVYIGTDDWAHSPVNVQVPLTLAPDTWGTPPPEASLRTAERQVVSKHAQRFNVRVDLELTLQDDLSVVVQTRSMLCEHYYAHGRRPTGDEIVTSGQAQPRTLEPGESTRIVVDHNSGNAPPDRAHVEFTVQNQHAPA